MVTLEPFSSYLRGRPRSKKVKYRERYTEDVGNAYQKLKNEMGMKALRNIAKKNERPQRSFCRILAGQKDSKK